MTDKPFIERSRLQVLYRYAPERTVYHERSDQAERVVALQMDPGLKDIPDIDPEQVRERLRQDLALFTDAELKPHEVAHYDLRIVRPDAVFTFVHPAVWFCPKCRRLYVPRLRGGDRREDQLRAIADHLPPGLKCTGKGNREPCGARLRQYTWLTTHNCGEELVVPAESLCRRHGDAYMYWYDQGSERVANWSLECKATGCDWGLNAFQSFMRIHKCPLAGKLTGRQRFLDTAPQQKATHHLPRVLNLLNSGTTYRSILNDDHDAAVAGAGVLRDAFSFASYKADAGFEEWRKAYSSGRASGGDLGAELAKWTKAKRATEMIPDPEAREAALGPIKEKLAQLGAAGSGIPYQKLTDLVKVPDYRNQMRDASIYMGNAAGYGLDRILSAAVDDAQAQDIKAAQAFFKDIGVHDLRYLEKVPLTAVLTGYMRGSYDHDETSLRLYTSGNELRVYANDGTTEAIWIQFDPSKTLRFLAQRTGVAADMQGDFSKDLLELQSRFDSSKRRAFAKIEDPWTKEHTKLLHTLSHLFIKAFGRHSGLQLEGLAEEVMPFSNSVLVYANQNGEFTLGGLQIVFEHHLRTVLAGLQSDSARCVYNPICDRSSGSCHACVHLGEVSCSHFNKLLDRRHLTGRNGFWQA